MEKMAQRHGCITFWLWLVIVMNVCMVLYYSVQMFNDFDSMVSLGIGLLSVAGVINILGAIQLMRWNKLGFYLYLVSSVIGVIINVFMLSLSPVIIFSSLMSVVVWWAILQIRKNGVSAWKLMKDGWDYRHNRHLYQVFIGISVVLLVLTIIACLKNHSNGDTVMIDDVFEEESAVVDTDSIEIIDGKKEENEGLLPSKNTVEWTVFEDNTGSVTIEAPSDFRELNLNQDQLISLGCSDYDPYIVIIQEPINTLADVSVNTVKEYSQLKLKMVQNSGGTDFKKIDEGDYGKDGYFAEFEMTVEDTPFYYKFITIKTQKYFYNCQVLCINQYKSKLSGQIEHIFDSFKILKH